MNGAMCGVAMGAALSSEDDLPQRDRWARLRFAIIGPLLAAPPAAGELHAALTVLAAKTWRHPFTGLDVRFGVSTIERWLYAAKKAADPVQALRNQVRRDIGRFPSLSAEAIAALTAQYRDHPGWTAQLHHDNLQGHAHRRGHQVPVVSERTTIPQSPGLLRRRPPKRSTDGAVAARERLEQREVRSYEVEHVLQLLHLDFHHGSRKVLTRSGTYVKPLLVGFIDDRSRFLCHAQWYTNEGSRELVHGLCQALQKVGLPRSLMTDNGSAMISGEFTAGLHRLGYFAPADPAVLTARQWQAGAPLGPHRGAPARHARRRSEPHPRATEPRHPGLDHPGVSPHRAQ
jgi:putative transposase